MLFISHSSADDALVRQLRLALATHGQPGWIDSRELRGGDPLWREIQQAIKSASAFAVLVSAAALQSKWVGKELKYALRVQKQRGKARFPIIPLALDGTRLGVLETLFAEEPTHLALSSAAGGIEAALDGILVALGRRHAADQPAPPQPRIEALEELVLELTDLDLHPQDATPRARARLRYRPATTGQQEVLSARHWPLQAPLSPFETDELRWYLEQYPIWPSDDLRERAHRVERDLVRWGQRLHQAALPPAEVADVMQAWARIDDHAERRFSIHVDAGHSADAGAADVVRIREAATRLLGLPWELLHDGASYLFQGARPTRVRRRLPSHHAQHLPTIAPPIRILLISARPEDRACGYIDHRASALPLVEAMEALPGQVELDLLDPPTLSALRQQLDRARRERRPYHVVHFDGHGVYDRQAGLGGLCFEHPEDSDLAERRRHLIVWAEELGPLLRHHRIPLVFLEACQSAQAEQASESVASELLKVGIASVVAMSHSVLVETASRFVSAFYRHLAAGGRVGEAMLEGQRQLAEDPARGRRLGGGELRLQDWFVPVLFQEQADPILFSHCPARQTLEDFQTSVRARLGALPPPPATGFIGRSRELLALQRRLRANTDAPYVVLTGQGGEGKSALAAELARWLVRSQQIERAAFVSLEGLERNIATSVLDALGRQLIHPGFATAIDSHGDGAQAEQTIARALREQATVLVMDNMESILLPPYLAQTTPDALSEEAQAQLHTVLALCQRLLHVGATRLIFTSREALPAPFAAPDQRHELQRLSRIDAVALIERSLRQSGRPTADDHASQRSQREQIEDLVEAVHGHARTLALLGPSLRRHGVAASHRALEALMQDMALRFPGSREQSLFASVELSLQRLSPANRERANALAAFHGSVDLNVLRILMADPPSHVDTLASELIETGLATANPHAHLSLNPALCPYLRARSEPAALAALTARWVEVMLGYVAVLDRERHKYSEMVATLTRLEQANLLALLERVQTAGDPAATVDLATSLHGLWQGLGQARLLTRLGQVLDAAAPTLGAGWNHAQFQAWPVRIEQWLDDGRKTEACADAQQLLQHARAAGEQAYPGADYDLAVACILLARALQQAGRAEPALPLLDEAHQRFAAIAREQASEAAARMASACITNQGDCLRVLSRLDAAAAAYEQAIAHDEQAGAERDVAVGQGQLGSVRLAQGRYPEALAAHAQARERFARLRELGSVAGAWHQTGMAHRLAGNPIAAEDAYRHALTICVQLDDVAGQAMTLSELGNLYDLALDRPEDAVIFYRQSMDKYVALGDTAGEGAVCSNLADTLCKLGRLDEARQICQRAIRCDAPFGHGAEPWKSWAILANIETAAGNPTAANGAKQQAIAAYLAFRRDGGENHSNAGRLSLTVSKRLHVGDTTQTASALAQLTTDPNATGPLLRFIHSLQAIVAGSRDRRLAEATDLDYTMAAELLWLIDSLEQPGT
jgi:tetratricopeptide (TPR) repeat protein